MPESFTDCSPGGSRTQQHANCLQYAHSQQMSLILARNNRKRKFKSRFPSVNFIFITLLPMLFFHGGLLVMCSKRCAAQNQRITLKERRAVVTRSYVLLFPVNRLVNFWENIRHFTTPPILSSRNVVRVLRLQKFHTVDLSLPRSG